ncbi:hypothetical protein LC087_17270 [Bacillus carboniphilus]|uniref:Uncharacterized protein n=1 Tax=Bacillus carboniphilus TaxID=86663 RepID=A0ABY9JSQ8_9BACI|nr:hypothetical protein [Bacillus carboniphilus]WLR42429.1 hypothetical protein LC087_17270 [Bacillus carboniphilus]
MLFIYLAFSPLLMNMMDLEYYLWAQEIIFILAAIPIYIDYKSQNKKAISIFILLIMIVSVIISEAVSIIN